MTDQEPITVLRAWQDYLKLVFPDGVKLTDIQHTEMKRAFYAGFGTCLIYSRDEIGALSENEAIIKFQELTEEVSKFFNETVKADEKRKEPT